MRRARIRGASSTGCLFSLLLFVAVLYYGVNIGEVYFRYYRLLDEIESQARIAAGLDNGTIARRIAAAVDGDRRSRFGAAGGRETYAHAA